MDPNQLATPPPTAPPPTSFWKHYRTRLVLFVIAPLLVLAGSFTFALTRPDVPAGSPATPGTSERKPAEEPAGEAVLQQLTSTPYGERFATVDAAQAFNSAATLAEAHDALQKFLDQYSIRLHTMAANPSSYVKQYDTFQTLQEADLPAFKAYGSMFIEEWSKYPTSLITAAHTKHVVIIKDLKVGSTPRAATPDPVGDAIYYDIGYGAAAYAREVVHHEYNHLIEYERYGNYSRTDKAWTAFNPADFAYNPNGGAAAYKESNFINDGHPAQGFVNRYAMYGMEEDKAEIFGYLMTDPYYSQLLEWSADDSKLAGKVELYKKFIAHLAPEMSGDYFNRIH